MIEVRLHGALRECASGAPIRLDAMSGAEAVLALCTQLPGFEARLRAGRWHLIGDGAEGLDREALGAQGLATLDIRPAAEGALPWFAWVGIGLLAAAVTFYLLPTPSAAPYTAAAGGGDPGPKSYLFDGATNATREGGAVPLVYGGPIRIGSTVVSGSIHSERATDIGDATSDPTLST